MPKVKFFFFAVSKLRQPFYAITSDIPDGRMCHTLVL